MSVTIYYDGECPFCQRYTDLLRLREAVGRVDLVNVREHSKVVDELESEGFDLDSGMVVEYEGRRYGGAAAMNRLASLVEPTQWFGKLNAVTFGSRYLASLVYPLLRAGRAATLLALGRQRVRPSRLDVTPLASVFTRAWAVCAIFQLVYAWVHAARAEFSPAVLIVGLLGLLLLLRPHSTRLFVVLTGAMLVDVYLQSASISNSTALRTFTLWGIVFAGLYALLRGRSWNEFFYSFAPIGRCLLLVMYFFGVFHKLNADFLNPAVSCAVVLWDRMPEPLRQLDYEWFKYSAMYGTLLVESFILVGLLVKKLRQLSIVAGIAFHGLLGVSLYEFYPTFSTLVITLHLLFLSPDAAARIIASPFWQAVARAVKTRVGIVAALAWLALLSLNIAAESQIGVIALWLPWIFAVLYLVARYGRDGAGERLVGHPVVSNAWGLNIIPLLFFVSCFAPYLGLKTAQSMNMFANLRLEGGQSNHLVFSNPPGPFTYLDDIVRPYNASGSKYLSSVEKDGLSLTYYDVLNQLDRNAEASVSFVRDGVVHEHETRDTLSGEIQRVLHPRWARRWLQFSPVDTTRPKKCWPNQ